MLLAFFGAAPGFRYRVLNADIRSPLRVVRRPTWVHDHAWAEVRAQGRDLLLQEAAFAWVRD